MKIYLFMNNAFSKEIAEIFVKNNAKVFALIFTDDAEKSYKDYILSILPHDESYNYTEFLECIIGNDEYIFDLGILCWWPHIIPQKLIDRARLGFINFHPSLLPWGRGKHPNFWTFVDKTPFGATIHWVDSKIDNGDIAYQSEIKKTWTDNAETLYLKARNTLLNIFNENFNSIYVGNIPRISKKSKNIVHYSKELDAASKIKLDKEYQASELLNLLRARTFSGCPACWFEDNNDVFEVRISITKKDIKEK